MGTAEAHDKSEDSVAHDACAALAAHDVRIRIGQVGGLVTLQVGDLSSFVAAASKRGIKGLARQ